MSKTFAMLLPLLAFSYVNFTLEKVHLSFRAVNLLNRDAGLIKKLGNGLSDPYFVLFAVNPLNQAKVTRVLKSSTIKDNLNPSWNEMFVTVNHPYENPLFRIDLFDDDGSQKDAEPLGTVMVNLDEILNDNLVNGRHEKNLTLPSDTTRFRSKDWDSRIVITATKLTINEELIHLKLTGDHLAAKDFFGTSDPYVEIYVPDKFGNYPAQPLYKTAKVDKNRINPTWVTIELYVDVLTQAGPNAEILFKVWDWNKKLKDELIGDCKLPVSAMIPAVGNTLTVGSFQIKGLKGKDSGTIKYQLYKSMSLVGYTTCNPPLIDVCHYVGIDFTKSNRQPYQSSNFHSYNYLNVGDVGNVYSRAIEETGLRMDNFQPRQKPYNVYGFGGKIPERMGKAFPAATFGGSVPEVINYQSYILKHVFNLNTHYNILPTTGAIGILQTYFGALPYVDLSGPSDCVEIIKAVAREFPAFKDNSKTTKYSILVVLTTAANEEKVKLGIELIAASKLPMSIVIVGVGPGKFELMKDLDNDDHVWKYWDEKTRTWDIAERDVMQFVRLEDFIPDLVILDQEVVKQNRFRLFLELYAEVFTQFRQNMKIRLQRQYTF